MKQSAAPSAACLPSVSIIIPAYNRAPLLRLALESALAQTIPPHEIIVVDDGSTDGTAELLAGYSQPVIAIRQENRGVSAARNRAIEHATGDVLLFLDSDDLLLPHCVERAGGAFAAHPEVDIVHADAAIIDAAGNRLGVFGQITHGQRNGDLLGELACQSILNMTSSAVRRAAIVDLRFDESMPCAEDYKFWCQLAARCKFHYIDEPLCCYRYHGDQATTLRVQRMLEDTIAVQRMVMEMPEFSRVSRRDKARAYTTHGVKHALCFRTIVARLYFWKAIETSPRYLNAWLLLAFSLLGGRFLRWTIALRRRLRGNYIEDEAIRLASQAAATISSNESVDRPPTVAAALVSAAGSTPHE